MGKIISKLLFKTITSELIYFSQIKGSKIEHRMNHEACFSGGMLALGSKSYTKGSDRYFQMNVSRSLTKTCRESYIRSATGLGPHEFVFYNNVEAKSDSRDSSYYDLNSELISSYFYLWRLTKEEMYRDWAWEVVLAIEKYCKTPKGYFGLEDVYYKKSVRKKEQKSFFMGETLKYLYLIFSNDDFISLDQWVFNTAGHPLPIKNKNPAYSNLDQTLF